MKTNFDFAAYGLHWRGADWDANIQNIRTGEKQSDRHRCQMCNHSPTRRCYEKFHMGYCVAIIEVNGAPAICGERMTVRSLGGCGIHKFNHGYNHCLQQAARGLVSEQPKPIKELQELVRSGKAGFEGGEFVIFDQDEAEALEESSEYDDPNTSDCLWEEIEAERKEREAKEAYAAKDARKIKAVERQDESQQRDRRGKGKKLQPAQQFKRKRHGKA
ncbi:hypothetical protein EJ04DRAFT_607445 [Polyplosphaeria fusca]|uniref:Uncharacterized protein n=1 Tax=Polyplosphaeria fusca TaxID=682080 RepID=A0A9P4UY16_9PLEO|nr:hypothetical protein EJ04DRAFT_607445 [Polyplosphaeria fusca]